ncbi:MAG: sodium/proton-translocating pyrophosphatase, partial [Thermoguttaceae bacterium]|nr:sodium/proton-translocating pyrophosphatase [Thermoguttaceae bacterium]
MKINKRFAIGLASALLAATFAFGTNDVVPCFAQDKAPTAVAVENNETEAPKADAVQEAATPVEAQTAAAADPAQAEQGSERKFFNLFGFLWVLSLAGAVAALVFAVKFYKTMMKADEGNEEMIKIASAVRKGANAYLKQQYKVVAI